MNEPKGRPGVPNTDETQVMRPQRNPPQPTEPLPQQQRPPRPQHQQLPQVPRPQQQPPPPPRSASNPHGQPPPRFVRQRPRRSIGRRIALGALLLFLAGIVGLIVVYVQIISVASAIVVDDARPNAPISSPLFGSNVLIVGVDERPGHPEEGVRSDTLIVTRIDAPQGWVALLSIPRDTRVELEGVGPTKINVAYGQGYALAMDRYGVGTTQSEGGMAFAAETVERFLNLPSRGHRIDYIAQINFDGFKGVIDALGGVTIDVPKPIVDDAYPTADFGVMRVEFAPGVQEMDGERALIYARTRHSDSDFGRGQRQQQVISAIVQKIKAMGWFGRLTTMPSLLKAVAGDENNPPAVRTTMPIDRIDVLLSILSLAGQIEPSSIGRFAVSPESAGLLYEEGSDLIWDPAGVDAVVGQLLTPPTVENEAATVQVLNGTEIAGLAGKLTTDLERAGFKVVPAGNAPTTDYAKTVIYDLRGKPATSAALAQRFDGAEVRGGSVPDGVFTDADILVILGPDAQAQP